MNLPVVSCAVRRERRRVLAGCRSGHYPPVVCGNRSTGYRIGAVVGKKIVLFGCVASRQRDALAQCEEKYGKARRVTLPKAA